MWYCSQGHSLHVKRAKHIVSPWNRSLRSGAADKRALNLVSRNTGEPRIRALHRPVRLVSSNNRITLAFFYGGEARYQGGILALQVFSCIS
jgi:hypothetical protein